MAAASGPASASASSAWAGSVQAVARRARAFGLQIHYHNRHQVHGAHRGGTRRDITGIASTRCWRGWISSPSTAPTRRRPITALARREDAETARHIVNTSRAVVIDEGSRWRCMLAGANSPAPSRRVRNRAINQSSRSLQNVVLLPHMGSGTIEGRLDMGEKVIINIKTFADGMQDDKITQLNWLLWIEEAANLGPLPRESESERLPLAAKLGGAGHDCTAIRRPF